MHLVFLLNLRAKVKANPGSRGNTGKSNLLPVSLQSRMLYRWLRKFGRCFSMMKESTCRRPAALRPRCRPKARFCRCRRMQPRLSMLRAFLPTPPSEKSPTSSDLSSASRLSASSRGRRGPARKSSCASPTSNLLCKQRLSSTLYKDIDSTETTSSACNFLTRSQTTSLKALSKPHLISPSIREATVEPIPALPRRLKGLNPAPTSPSPSQAASFLTPLPTTMLDFGLSLTSLESAICLV